MKRYEAYKPVTSRWAKQLPFYWEFQKIAEVFIERKENNDPIKTTNILSLTNTRGVIPYSDKGNLGNKAKNDIRGYRLAYPGDIVLNSMNVVIGSVGLSQYYGAVSPVYCMLYVRNNTKYNVRYYNYVFQDKIFQGGLNGLGNGILEIRMRIPMSKLKYVCVPVPPRDEQDQIVRYLDWQVSKINRLIAAKRKQIELLHEQFSAVINSTISGYDSSVPKYDSGISLFGQIPQGWHVRPFSKIATVKSNLVDPALYKDMQQISPASIEKNTARILELCTVEQAGVSSPNHYFYKGQIIYSKIRPLLNKVIIAPFDGLCSADMYPIETVLDTEYLLFYLLSSSYLQQLSVTANRVKMPKINQEELGATLVLIPPEQEQREIVAIIKSKCSKIQLLIEKIKLQIDAASDLRTRLISDVVTGQIDVRGIEVPNYEHYDEAPENATEESSDSDYDTEE